MEKIKSVLSHGSRKSTDATHDTNVSKHSDSSTGAPTGQGSHFGASGDKTETTPIYDEMTGQSPRATSSREPVKTNEAPPHFSNTASLKNSSTTASTAKPPVTATPVSSQPGLFNEGGSTASIKSGVIGFPQGEDSHAVLSKTKSQNSGKESALGAGSSGTTGIVPQLHHQRDHDNLRASSIGQPFDQSSQGPQLTTDTDRSFPLAGGVTTRNQADYNPASHPVQAQPITTAEREPVAKESNLPASHGHAKEGLAGAAALAAATGAYSATRSSDQPEELVRSSDRDYDNLRAEHELRSGHEHGVTNPADSFVNPSAGVPASSELGQDSHHHGNLALAAATTAAATSSSTPRHDPNKDHTHGGHGHTFSGDPCEANKDGRTNVFTSGPHATDTANLFDPRQEAHLHIPGEYPETPAETPLDHKTGATGGYMGGNSAHHEDIVSNQPVTSGEQSHHGRDAAIAGGLGAAGVGAYAATRDHREPAETTIASEASPYSSTKMDPRVNPQAAKLEKSQIIPSQTQPSTSGYSQSTSSQQGTIAPTSTTEQEPEHHYGRNAGVAGAGVGLIGAGAAAAHLAHREEQREPQSNLASSTPGDNVFQPGQPIAGHHEPRSTFEPPTTTQVGHGNNTLNVHDAQVQSQPEQYKPHSTSGPHNSNTLNRLDPKVDSSEHQAKGDHHYGRGAAIAGGTGATGLGAYEAATKYDEHRSTGPAASMNDQRYDPTLSGAHDPNQTGQHHYGRDAAVVGGLGAAGAGAYAVSQHREGNSHPTGSSQNFPTTTTGHPQEYQAQQAERDPAHQRYDSVQNPEQHHDKRTAAALGAAGVAGAGGAYAYSQYDAEKVEKARLAQEKAQNKAAEKDFHAQEKAQKKAEEKELDHQRKEQQKLIDHDRKQQQKELDHKLKEQEKAFQHEQHKIEQQQAYDQKHQAALAAADEKAQGKRLEKERSRRSDEIEQDDQEGKEKKHRLFGFLHRDKTKKPHSNESSPRQSREYATGSAAAGLGASEISHESDSSEGKKQGRHRLHKDPPRGHPAYEALEQQQQQQQQQYGQSGNALPDRTNRFSGEHRDTRPGAYDSYAPDQQQPNKVTEPHTGLPMNIGAYGDGRGGTDGSATIPGHHDVPGATGSTQGQTGVTDWEAIRKANTTY